MTFKEYNMEIDPIKEEWYVCEYLHYNTQIDSGYYGKLDKYWVTRNPDMDIYKDKISQKPQTITEARKFRTILNKLTGN